MFITLTQKAGDQYEVMRFIKNKSFGAGQILCATVSHGHANGLVPEARRIIGVFKL